MLALPAAAQSFDADARSFMADLIKLSDFSRSKDGAFSADSNQLVQQISKKIDFPKLAQTSLGATRWKGIQESERTQFLKTLQELLEVVIYPEARKITSKAADLKYEGGKTRVTVQAPIEREKRGELITKVVQIVLIYDTKTRRVEDAILEGEQISQNLRRQFDQALKKQKFADILTKMRKRVDQARTSNSQRNTKKSV